MALARKTLEERNKRLAAGLALSQKAAARVEVAKEEASAAWPQLSQNPLFMLGVGIYMGEGDKRTPCLRIANSDPGIIKVWLAWCDAFLPTDSEFVAGLLIHDNRSVPAAERYWRRVIGRRRTVRFVKTCVLISSSSKGRRDTNRCPFGTINVRLGKGSRFWHARMMRWIELTYQGGARMGERRVRDAEDGGSTPLTLTNTRA